MIWTSACPRPGMPPRASSGEMDLLKMSNTVMKPYKLIRSRRRTIALMISADATLVVRAPAHTPLDAIERVIGKNTEWIQRAIARSQKRPQARKKEFVSGEEFLFLGKPYLLEVQSDTSQPLHLRDGFVLGEEHRGRGRELFIEWYKKRGAKDHRGARRVVGAAFWPRV